MGYNLTQRCEGVGLSKSLYLCTNCRTKIDDPYRVLFVDQSHSHGFCSEKCILEYYTPVMESFENEEFDLRESLKISFSEGLEGLYKDQSLFNQILYQPSEVWRDENKIGQTFYTHILKVNYQDDNFYYAMICSYFNDEPSFVYFKTMSRIESLINKYRSGEKVELNQELSSLIKNNTSNLEESNDKKEQNIELSESFLEDIEVKKSEYLAKMLDVRSELDIPIEEFYFYDDYMPMCLEDPDEVYQSEDDHGDELKVFIKSFKKQNKTFFYIVLSIEIEVNVNSNDKEIALMPVLGFPSTDTSLYKEYTQGVKLSQVLKN